MSSILLIWKLHDFSFLLSPSSCFLVACIFLYIVIFIPYILFSRVLASRQVSLFSSLGLWTYISSLHFVLLMLISSFTAFFFSFLIPPLWLPLFFFFNVLYFSFPRNQDIPSRQVKHLRCRLYVFPP